jgi:beta-galactosidase
MVRSHAADAADATESSPLLLVVAGQAQRQPNVQESDGGLPPSRWRTRNRHTDNHNSFLRRIFGSSGSSSSSSSSRWGGCGFMIAAASGLIAAAAGLAVAFQSTRVEGAFAIPSSALLRVSQDMTARPMKHDLQQLQSQHSDQQVSAFPPHFVWGVATSSYQVEGAAHADGREPSIWDDFCASNDSTSAHRILDGSNGSVACDHYHRFQEDVELMASLGFRSYRFSVSWSRLLHSDMTINPSGLQFYRALVDALVARNITPWITVFHWDLPASLPGGWRNASTVDAFATYADLLFEALGDRVTHWITLNEPWTICVNGYGTGVHAPGHVSDTEPYVVGHHLLLAHAQAVQLFRRRFGNSHNKSRYKIGIANCGDYRYPRDPRSPEDRASADRAMEFQWGWFVDPLVKGDYPSVMREALGSRLPHFTPEERDMVRNSYDFLGLNYYSSLLASVLMEPPHYAGYWADMGVNLTMDPTWDRNDMGWSVVPAGLRDMLQWISNRYDSPILYVTENGSAEPEPELKSALHDAKRRHYFEQHLVACAEAMRGGNDEDHRSSPGRAVSQAKVNLRGYFAWSLLDNFEWQFGYQRRFGVCYVDFATLQRTPKGSAYFLRDTIRARGATLPLRLASDHRRDQALEAEDAKDQAPRRDLVEPSRHPRTLPERVVLGYGNNVPAVKQAVRDGVNVVVWSFVDFRRVDEPSLKVTQDDTAADSRLLDSSMQTITNLNLTEVREAIEQLDKDGYSQTVHLMSVGGWNGPHLDPAVSALDWYRAFRQHVGDLFHGLDWDLEGNDDLDSPYNVFTTDCLDKMADISRLAKAGTCAAVDSIDSTRFEPHSVLVLVVDPRERGIHRRNGAAPELLGCFRQWQPCVQPVREPYRRVEDLAQRILVLWSQRVRVLAPQGRGLDRRGLSPVLRELFSRVHGHCSRRNIAVGVPGAVH